MELRYTVKMGLCSDSIKKYAADRETAERIAAHYSVLYSCNTYVIYDNAIIAEYDMDGNREQIF